MYHNYKFFLKTKLCSTYFGQINWLQEKQGKIFLACSAYKDEFISITKRKRAWHSTDIFSCFSLNQSSSKGKGLKEIDRDLVFNKDQRIPQVFSTLFFR